MKVVAQRAGCPRAPFDCPMKGAGKMRRIVLSLIAVAAGVVPAVASAATPLESAAGVRAFVTRYHSTAELGRALAALSPGERRYVIRLGLTPALARYSVSGARAAGAPASRPVAIAARHLHFAQGPQGPWYDSYDPLVTEAACGSYHHRDFTAKSYSWVGLWLFTFHSQWQWTTCGGRVTTAHHQERGDTAIGWSFEGSQYGAGYGCMNCSMIGRETFGHFGFLKYAVHDTADLQVQVRGNGGWWAWAKITGP